MLSVFVSSTFRDMQGERDAIRGITVPALRETAKKYDQDVNFIDLRWGISTDDLDSNEGARKILEVCMREIDSCVPCMVVLLGERYGWMPDAGLIRDSAREMGYTPEDSAISVTELEIQYGMWKNSGQLDHCFFCLRRDLPAEQMPEKMRGIYGAGSEEDKQHMALLKEKIRSTPGVHIMEYDLSYDPETQTLGGYQEFAEQLAALMTETMQKDWKEEGERSWQMKLAMQNVDLCARMAERCIGRNETIGMLYQDLKDVPIIVLKGETGAGKTTVLGTLAVLLSKEGRCIYYRCGSGETSRTTGQMLQFLTWFCKGAPGSKEPEHGNAEAWRDRWFKTLAEYDDRELFIIIDGIEKLQPDLALQRSWFIPRRWPSKVHFLISTNGEADLSPLKVKCLGEMPQDLIFHFAYWLHGLLLRQELEALDDEAVRKIAEASFKREHKEPAGPVLDAVCAHPLSKNMLGLELIVRRLLILGQQDFDKIDELGKTMDGGSAISAYLTELVNDMPTKMETLFPYYIRSARNSLFGEGTEEDQGMGITLLFIASMNNGLSTQSLSEIMDYFRRILRESPENHPWRNFWNPLAFARLKRYLEGLLIEQDDGRLVFGNRLLKASLRENRQTQMTARLICLYMGSQKDAEDPDMLENILPLTRLTWLELKRYSFPEREECDGALGKVLRHIMALENSGDEAQQKRAERMKQTLHESFLQDVSGEKGGDHLSQYLQMLEHRVKEGCGPCAPLVRPFEDFIARPLSFQGVREQATAFQIRVTLAGKLLEQEKTSGGDWTAEDHAAVLRYVILSIDSYFRLLPEIEMKRPDAGLVCGYNIESLFRDGEALCRERLKTAEGKERADLLLWLAQMQQALSAALGRYLFTGRAFSIVKDAEQTVKELQAFAGKDRAFEEQAVRAGLLADAGYLDVCRMLYVGGAKHSGSALDKALQRGTQALSRLETEQTQEKEQYRFEACRLMNSWCGVLYAGKDFSRIAAEVWPFYRDTMSTAGVQLTKECKREMTSIAAMLAWTLLQGNRFTNEAEELIRTSEAALFILSHENDALEAYADGSYEQRGQAVLLLLLRAYAQHHAEEGAGAVPGADGYSAKSKETEGSLTARETNEIMKDMVDEACSLWIRPVFKTPKRGGYKIYLEPLPTYINNEIYPFIEHYRWKEKDT